MNGAGLRRVAGWIASIELPLVVLIAPALLFPSPARLLAALAVPVIWLANRYARGAWIPSTPVNLSIVLLLLMSGISLLATFDVGFSLGKVAGLWLGVFLFWAIVRFTVTRDRLQLATAALVVAGAALAVIGLLGTKWIGKFAPLTALTAHLPTVIRGLPGAEAGFQPNAVAGSLLLFIPLQAGLVLNEIRARPRRPGGAWRLAALALPLALTSMTLALTQSRGGAAGLAMGTVAALLWIGGTPRRLTLAAVGLALVAGAVIGPSRLAWLAGAQVGIAQDVSSRTEVWSRAVYGIQDFPLTGMGMNTFRTVMPVLYPSRETSGGYDVAHAHNHFLQAALDLGLPGLVAYLAVWIGIGVALVRTYRAAGDRRDRILAGGLGAGLVAHFGFGTTDAIPLGAKVGVLFWMTLAVAISLHQIAGPGDSSQPPRSAAP